jgi:rRNA maturation RNase YbeY
MTFMKRHPFLIVDYHSTVELTLSEERKMRKWLAIAGPVVSDLIRLKIIPTSPKELQVSLLICGDARIRKLNQLHRHKDKVTDVLSFPTYENLRKIKVKDEHLFLGDLAICHSQTKRQAHKFGISYLDEFIHLFFHGLIHLMGYDHELSEKEEMLMQQWEQEALKRFSELKKRPAKAGPLTILSSYLFMSADFSRANFRLSRPSDAIFPLN